MAKKVKDKEKDIKKAASTATDEAARKVKSPGKSKSVRRPSKKKEAAPSAKSETEKTSVKTKSERRPSKKKETAPSAKSETEKKPVKTKSERRPSKKKEAAPSAKSETEKTPVRSKSGGRPSKKKETAAAAKAETEKTSVKTKSERRPSKKKETALPEKAETEKTPVRSKSGGRPAKKKETALPEKTETEKTPVRSKSGAMPSKKKETAAIEESRKPEKMSVQAHDQSSTLSKEDKQFTEEKTHKKANKKSQKKGKKHPKGGKSSKKEKEKLDKIFDEVKSPPINREKLIHPDHFIIPEYSGFFEKFENFLQNDLLIDDNSKILIAVSGGVDSVTLLDAFANLAVKHRFFLYMVHFNHNLRGADSDEDEMFVRRLAKEYNIPVHATRGNVKQYAEANSVSIEQAARTLRYRFIEQTARTLKVNYVATAHTLDDNAETFLLNLVRGSGLTGLSGIPGKRPIGKGISIIRPFLCFKKHELKKYAETRELVWREDESNSLLIYTRNKVRHSLIKKLAHGYNPAIVDVLNRTTRILRGADKFISDHVKPYLRNVIIDKRENRFSLRIPTLHTFSDFIQGEIIQMAVKNFFQLQPLSLNIIDRILELTYSPSGSICEFSGSYAALKDRTRIIFYKKEKVIRDKIVIERKGEFDYGAYKIKLSQISRDEMKFDNDRSTEFFDLDLVPGILYLRTWEQGDAFQPLGMTGTMKVSDFLTNEKVSLIDKQNTVLLTTKSDIIWICGRRISEKYKVTENTKKILKAEFIRK